MPESRFESARRGDGGIGDDAGLLDGASALGWLEDPANDGGFDAGFEFR